MHINNDEYTRLVRTYWTSIATMTASALVAILLWFYYAGLGLGWELVRFSAETRLMSLVFYLAVVGAIGSLSVVAFWTLPRLTQLHNVKDVIERLMKALEHCGITTESLTLFKTYNDYTISAKRRRSGGFTLVVQTPLGIQREMVIQRYRIDYGLEVGVDLPITEYAYVKGLTLFIEGQVAGELVVSELEYQRIPDPGQQLGLDASDVRSR